MRHIFPSLLLNPLVLLLVPLVLFEYLNFTGFCYGQGRYYSDEELVDAAITYNLSKYGSDPAIKKRYESIGELGRQNPECCTIHRYGHWSLDPIWVRAFGFYIVVVEVWYRVNETSGAASFYDSLVSFDACGKIVDTTGILESHGRIVPAGK